MPFNKGDFTQQGVAGHVNANLRLNEKRLVNIDLTSNEEAEGCTIAGTVTDLLNDKVYNIGSGASGKITITENGTDIDVARYRLADVNVSGGGGETVPKCVITLVNTEAGYQTSFENGIFVYKRVTENGTLNKLYMQEYPEAATYYVDFNPAMGSVLNAESHVSNLVNLTVENNTIYVTDITADSSCTIDYAEYLAH